MRADATRTTGTLTSTRIKLRSTTTVVRSWLT